ncbi:uncharacterized protein B0H64DRAFT_455035 [Chaetomium fimeti]
MAFIQDPRLRQTWNQLSHTTEAVTSDAAAGIWTFGHRYINPCLASLGAAVDSCAAVCLGDRDERARRARERDRGARGSRRTTTVGRAAPEYSFDFYDDWEEDFAAEFEADAGGREGESHHHHGRNDEEGPRQQQQRQQGKRPRSDTTTSGDTSSSYRSRGDLFPSDGEGDEDAVPLGDEFTVALERVDDRGSTKTRSSKGKRPADRDRDRGLSRTVSRTTLSSTHTPEESKWDSNPVSPVQEVESPVQAPSLEDLRREEEQAAKEEYEEIERRRRAAAQLAMQRGLGKDGSEPLNNTDEAESDAPNNQPQPTPITEGLAPNLRRTTIDDDELEEIEFKPPHPATREPSPTPTKKTNGELRVENTFVPARLPHFG